MDKDFQEKFKKYFGCTPLKMKYQLEDLSNRLNRLEDVTKQMRPVLGASIAKVQGMESVVGNQFGHMDFEGEVMKETASLLKQPLEELKKIKRL